MSAVEEARDRIANPRFVVFADDLSGLRLDIDKMLAAARADGRAEERARYDSVIKKCPEGTCYLCSGCRAVLTGVDT